MVKAGRDGSAVTLDGAELVRDVSPARIRRHRSARADLVWTLGLLAYAVAVTGRSSFGFAAEEAVGRFGVSATALSMFGVVQLGTYAAAQFPAGLLLDRYGARTMLLGGSALMLIGQLSLALTDIFGVALTARILIGAGDAAIFISVLRLVTSWFPARRVPLMTQLTSVVGQLGQVLAAVPFYAVLLTAGWTAAFGSLAAVLLVVILLVAVGVSDEPDGLPTGAIPVLRASSGAVLKDVLTSPGAWAGMFTHATGLSITNMFTVLWGVPLLTLGHGLSAAEVSLLLMATVGASIVLGPVIGWFTGGNPQRRGPLVLTLLAIYLVVWTVTLAMPVPLPLPALVPMMLALGLGGAWCNVGFDFARTGVAPMSVGTASGFVNVGGFTGGLLATFIIGLVLDLRAPDGDYQLADFRLGFALSLALLVIAAIGLVVCLRLGGGAPRPRTGQLPAQNADAAIGAEGPVGPQLDIRTAEAADLEDPELAAFVTAHHADMAHTAPPESLHGLSVEQLRDPAVLLFTAHWREEPGASAQLVGMVGLRPVAGEAGHLELKSMRVDPSIRGQGLGARLLLHAIDAAHDIGARRISLETGSQEYFASARRLYARHGFVETGPFGEYTEDPTSTYMTRQLRGQH